MRPKELTAIEAQVVDGRLVIPHGMTPIYSHVLQGRMIAYVEGWSAEKEYDQSCFDLYSLSGAQYYILHNTFNGEKVDQEWYISFGAPMKEARKHNGELVIRERVE